MTEESRNRTIGKARAIATKPLKSIPIFMNSPRRESIFSFDIFRLLVLGVIRSRVWMPRVLNPPRGEPGDYVGNFLVRHKPARHVSPPIRRSQLRAARDDTRAQLLIADERQKRIIRDRAAFASASTACAVAGLAEGLICNFASLGVTH